MTCEAERRGRVEIRESLRCRLLCTRLNLRRLGCMLLSLTALCEILLILTLGLSVCVKMWSAPLWFRMNLVLEAPALLLWTLLKVSTLLSRAVSLTVQTLRCLRSGPILMTVMSVERMWNLRDSDRLLLAVRIRLGISVRWAGRRILLMLRNLRNGRNDTSMTDNSYACAVGKETSKGSLSEAGVGEAYVTTGLNGVGKLMSGNASVGCEGHEAI